MTTSSELAHQSYPEPLASFLTLGKPAARADQWLDYSALGITAEHISQLISMATDEQLNTQTPSHDDAVWAPVHAWRALGQLRAVEAAGPLSRLFDIMEDDDWVSSELPHVFALIGKPALPVLAEYIRQNSHGAFPRAVAAEAMVEVARAHPDTRDGCVATITAQLERFASQDSTLNGLLVGALIDLRAVEAATVMERAFAADSVDLTVAGDWEDVQMDLGLLAERLTPRPRLWDSGFAPMMTSPQGALPTQAVVRTRENTKHRRQMVKASRRRNRKRKKK